MNGRNPGKVTTINEGWLDGETNKYEGKNIEEGRICLVYLLL